MTREETIRLLQFLKGCYPNAKIDDPHGMIDAWSLAFSSDPAGDVYRAARLHMTHNTYFPTPANINECMYKAKLLFDADAGANKKKMLPDGDDADMIELLYWANDLTPQD